MTAVFLTSQLYPERGVRRRRHPSVILIGVGRRRRQCVILTMNVVGDVVKDATALS